MKFNPKLASKALFTIVGGAVLVNPVFAQEQDQGEVLDEVVVTGLRGSLKASLETKRDALGVVDSINAEDIGKFPDTNLAESLQRITGISIDRRNGEGAQVTARGFGPQFNLITLNGRQLPSADAFGNGDAVTGGQGAAGRSFNFANLSSEAVSAVEVYKTARADIASGGIGATVNIRTARPLDNDGVVANFGAKGMYDESSPFGQGLTPEVSGIFSFANDAKNFGIGVNATYSKRKSGGVESTVNDWVMRTWDDANLPSNVFNGSTIIGNRPSNGDLYGIPNDVRYAYSAFERERINAQAILQFAPTDTLTFTLDYTTATNEIKQDRGEQTMWLQQGTTFDEIIFDTDGEVATPLYIFEMTAGRTAAPGSGYSNKDFGFEQQHNEQRNELDSLGFNADWQVTDRFSLAFDAHRSEGTSSPNDPVTGGSQTAFSFAGVPMCSGQATTVGNIAPTAARPNPPPCAGFVAQEYDFSGALPVATRWIFDNTNGMGHDNALARENGNPNYVFGANYLGSQIMRINYQQSDSVIEQYRLDGKFELNENNRFAFGVEQRDMDWHQRSSNNQMTMGDWGANDAGTTRGASLATVLTPYSLVGLFEDFNSGTASPNAYRANANDLAQWAFANGYTNWNTGSGAPNGFLTYNPTWGNDNYVLEEIKAAYLQYQLKGELGAMPFNLNLGYRIEDTDVTSTSFIAIPLAVRWEANNDFAIPRTSSIEPYTEEASYDNKLPSVDFDIGLTDSLKARASWGKTIARANIGNLTAGPTPGGPSGATLINPATRGGGNSNNPALIPLESTNIDVSLEWYFNDTGYISAGFWKKDVENFIGNSIVEMNLFGLTDPTAGPDAQAALAFLDANNIARSDTSLFVATALQRFDTLNLANYNTAAGNLQATELAYDIDGSAARGDPLYTFNVNVPLNQEEAKIDGWEIGGQYFFGESGIGVLANYTIVNGGDATEFNNAGPTNVNQFALLGLSDTANVVLMFEKFGITARLAWNWRDEFLLSANNGGSRNPRYVEAYEQYDLSLGYDLSDNLSVSFDAINLTGEDIRWHGRSENMMVRLEDQSARYAVGMRYKF
jgi:TonB-dependent receptor